MASKIKLVQGDTRPQLRYTVSDETTNTIVDLTGAAVLLKFREAGASVILFTLTGVLLSGIENESGTVIQNLPGDTYEVPGSGGIVAFAFQTGNLDIDPGVYEGELEVTFGAPNAGIQTVYSVSKFQVRAQF